MTAIRDIINKNHFLAFCKRSDPWGRYDFSDAARLFLHLGNEYGLSEAVSEFGIWIKSVYAGVKEFRRFSNWQKIHEEIRNSFTRHRAFSDLYVAWIKAFLAEEEKVFYQNCRMPYLVKQHDERTFQKLLSKLKNGESLGGPADIDEQFNNSHSKYVDVIKELQSSVNAIDVCPECKQTFHYVYPRTRPDTFISYHFTADKKFCPRSGKKYNFVEGTDE